MSLWDETGGGEDWEKHGEDWKEDEQPALLLCDCCKEAIIGLPCGDADVGVVCEDCHWRLRAVRNDLYTISQQPL